MLLQGFEILIIDPATGNVYHEYAVNVQGRSISCFVTSLYSKPYHVLIKRHDHTQTNALNIAVWCTADGRLDQRVHGLLGPKESTIINEKCEPWVFSSVPDPSMWTFVPGVDGPWTITVRTQRMDQRLPRATPELTALRLESSARTRQRPDMSAIDTFDDPFVTFIFRYGPLQLLQNIGIVPLCTIPTRQASHPLDGPSSATSNLSRLPAPPPTSQASFSSSFAHPVPLPAQSDSVHDTITQSDSSATSLPVSAQDDIALLNQFMLCGTTTSLEESGSQEHRDTRTARQPCPRLTALQIPDLPALSQPAMSDAFPAISALGPSPAHDLEVLFTNHASSASGLSTVSHTDHFSTTAHAYSMPTTPARSDPSSIHNPSAPSYGAPTPVYGIIPSPACAYDSPSPVYRAPSSAYGARSPAPYAYSLDSYSPSPVSFAPSPDQFGHSSVGYAPSPDDVGGPLPEYGAMTPPPPAYSQTYQSGSHGSHRGTPAPTAAARPSNIGQPKPLSPPQNRLLVPGMSHSSSETRSPKRKLEELDSSQNDTERAPAMRRQRLPQGIDIVDLELVADHDRPCLSRGKQHQHVPEPRDDLDDLELLQWLQELDELQVKAGELKKKITGRRNENAKKSQKAQKEATKSKKKRKGPKAAPAS